MIRGMFAMFALSAVMNMLQLCRSDEGIRDRWRERADEQHSVLVNRLDALLSLTISVVFLIGCWRLL